MTTVARVPKARSKGQSPLQSLHQPHRATKALSYGAKKQYDHDTHPASPKEFIPLKRCRQLLVISQQVQRDERRQQRVHKRKSNHICALSLTAAPELIQDLLQVIALDRWHQPMEANGYTLAGSWPY